MRRFPRADHRPTTALHIANASQSALVSKNLDDWAMPPTRDHKPDQPGLLEGLQPPAGLVAGEVEFPQHAASDFDRASRLHYTSHKPQTETDAKSRRTSVGRPREPPKRDWASKEGLALLMPWRRRPGAVVGGIGWPSGRSELLKIHADRFLVFPSRLHPKEKKQLLYKTQLKDCPGSAVSPNNISRNAELPVDFLAR
jgi:hypothetical protein